MNGSYLLAAVLAVTLAIVTAEDRPILPVPTSCPAIDSKNYTVHLAHESDCTKFYKCLMGERILHICPLRDRFGRRLHFNRVLQVCDWPQNAHCSGPDPTYPTPTSDIIHTVTFPPPTNPPPSNVCPPKGSGGIIFLPHECLCDRYYICIDGNQIGQKCPDGFHWDRYNWVCTTPERAKCPHWHPDPTYPTPSPTPSPTPPPITWPPPTTTPRPRPTVCPPKGSSEIVYLPHECQCDRYYVCVDGNAIVQVCPGGFHWDRLDWVCTTPERAKCPNWHPEPTYPTPSPTPSPTTPSTPPPITWPPPTTTPRPRPTVCPPKGSSEIVYLPHECQCDRYYVCVDGNAIVQVCPGGFHWDRLDWVCTTPERAKCPNWHPEPTYPTPSPTTPSTPPPITWPPPTTTPRPRPTVCPPKGSSEIVYLPHECQCDRYYVCIDGNSIVQVCPTGLHWDRLKWVCTTPSEAKCPDWHPTGILYSDVDIKEVITAAKVRAPIPPDTTIPTECPVIDSGTAVHLRHETTCSKYYICRSGEKIIQDCPIGLHFNPILQICDWPKECVDKKTAVSSIGIVPRKDLRNCPPKGTDERVLLPHEDHSGKYYKCTDGEKVAFMCPIGLHFDPILEVCDWSENVYCSKSIITLPPAIDDIPTECPPKDSDEIAFVPHETNCSLFYQCKDGQKILQKCGKGFLYNPKLQVCDWPENVRCENSRNSNVLDNSTDLTPVPKPVECPSEDSGAIVQLPHETNCSLFYKCDYGVKTTEECPSGFHFNKKLEICDWPEMAGCEDKVKTPPSSTAAEINPDEEDLNESSFSFVNIPIFGRVF